MEYYDTFSEDGVFLSSEDEGDVLYKGLWHKVIRVWIYDKEGNVYLRVRKKDGKLDCIDELNLLSSESVTSCFDRGMFNRLGIHFPAESTIKQVYSRKVKIHKVYSDNSELKNNYFLCDYIGEFDNNIGYFIFDGETSGLIKISAKGVLTLLNMRTGERIAYNVTPNGAPEGERKIVTIDDIYNNQNEDLFSKFSFVLNSIVQEAQAHEKELREQEKMQKYYEKNKKEEIVSHADENEGDEIY